MTRSRPVRHFVTDRRRFGLSVDELVVRATRAAALGVDVIQVREGDLPDVQLVTLVRAIAAAVQGLPTRVLVNDRSDIAIAAGAAGVHLPGSGISASRVKAMLPPEFIVGRSVHSEAEVAAAVADGGCDYLLFGTVFPSAGKPDGHPVAGLDALRAICVMSSVPIIAIGGVSERNAAEVLEAGAAGFAAVGMFMRPAVHSVDMHPSLGK